MQLNTSLPTETIVGLGAITTTAREAGEGPRSPRGNVRTWQAATGANGYELAVDVVGVAKPNGPKQAPLPVGRLVGAMSGPNQSEQSELIQHSRLAAQTSPPIPNAMAREFLRSNAKSGPVAPARSMVTLSAGRGGRN